MGHTLVAVFSDGLRAEIDAAVKGYPANKIPFGRTDDRDAADRILPYHATLLHCGRAQDAVFSAQTAQLHMPPFSLTAECAAVWRASEEEYLAVLLLRPGRGFAAMQQELHARYGAEAGNDLHITVSVSGDRALILRQRQLLEQALTFPKELPVSALELYQIWNPVRLVRRITPEGGRG